MSKRTMAVSALVLVLILSASLALAQNAGSLRWWTVTGGGGRLVTDSYALDGTVGQAEAATWQGSDSYTLAGGFWSSAGTEADELNVYLPALYGGGSGARRADTTERRTFLPDLFR